MSNEIDASTHRQLAVDLFNGVWSLLDNPYRTPAEDAQMIHAAHASRHHWGAVGGPKQFSVGEWQISRVYATLGRAEPALYHARLALEWAMTAEAGPFYVGYGHEALARAYALAGNAAERDRSLAAAEQSASQLTKAEDAKTLRDDVAAIRGSGG